jgi:hypothetical protein
MAYEPLMHADLTLIRTKKKISVPSAKISGSWVLTWTCQSVRLTLVASLLFSRVPVSGVFPSAHTQAILGYEFVV